MVTPADRRGKHTGGIRGHKARALLRQPKGADRALDRPAAPAHQLAITLLLLPVFYSISVLDLKIAKWEPGKH